MMCESSKVAFDLKKSTLQRQSVVGRQSRDVFLANSLVVWAQTGRCGGIISCMTWNGDSRMRSKQSCKAKCRHLLLHVASRRYDDGQTVCMM